MIEEVIVKCKSFLIMIGIGLGKIEFFLMLILLKLVIEVSLKFEVFIDLVVCVLLFYLMNVLVND